jgi:hypothetical protein
MVTGLMSDARNIVASGLGPLFDMGARAERERIIALLENLIGDREAAIYIDEFIALIKNGK